MAAPSNETLAVLIEGLRRDLDDERKGRRIRDAKHEADQRWFRRIIIGAAVVGASSIIFAIFRVGLAAIPEVGL